MDFPAHWGPTPKIQTKDVRELPGGFGRGSSTLAGWIKNNLDADALGRARGQRPKSAAQLAEEQAAAAAAKDLADAAAHRVAIRNQRAKDEAEELMMGGGKGTYMTHDAEWYRKWQYRKEYSDNRLNRHVSNYRMHSSPEMRRMQMQMMHGH